MLLHTGTGAVVILAEATSLTLLSGAFPVQRTGTGTVRVISTTMGIDASGSRINAHEAGDILRNTNAALACGVGLVVSDGGA